MKKKMSLAAEIDLTQDSVVQLTSWCGQIALHELWGLGRVRLDRITRRQEQLGNESLAVVMVPDRNGMPQTEKARQLRAEALPEGVPVEFRVPALRVRGAADRGDRGGEHRRREDRADAEPELSGAGGRVHQAGRDDGRRTAGRKAGRGGAAAFRRRGAPEDRGGEGTDGHRGLPEEGLRWA